MRLMRFTARRTQKEGGKKTILIPMKVVKGVGQVLSEGVWQDAASEFTIYELRFTRWKELAAGMRNSRGRRVSGGSDWWHCFWTRSAGEKGHFTKRTQM